MKSSLTCILISLTTGMLSGCGVDDSDPEEMLETTTQSLSANAYGFALTDTFMGNPNSSYSANTGGGPITIVNLMTGTYRVTFGGLGGPGGNAQVVAYGADNTRCKVQSWFQSGSDELVNVLCHTPSGSLTDSKFIVRYGRTSSSGPGAYLWADQPSAASYTPTLAYSFNSTGVANTIARSGVGTYTVNLPGLGGTDGNVLVTAHGNSSTHCNVTSWGSLPGNRPIEVRCWSAAGVLADSTFSLAFDGAGVTGFNQVGAFAWANNPTSASYFPNASYSYHSSIFPCSPGVTSAGRLSTGSYFMRHSSMPATHSTVHVTARSSLSTSDYCKVEGLIPWSNGVEVKTRCFNASGALKDGEYAESYYTTEGKAPC